MDNQFIFSGNKDDNSKYNLTMEIGKTYLVTYYKKEQEVKLIARLQNILFKKDTIKFCFDSSESLKAKTIYLLINDIKLIQEIPNKIIEIDTKDFSKQLISLLIEYDYDSIFNIDSSYISELMINYMKENLSLDYKKNIKYI